MLFRPKQVLLWALAALPLSLPLAGRLSAENAADGKVHVIYWEKWTGVEGAAIQAVVRDFNASQDHIVVDYMAISGIDQKTLVATAGGVPPDVAGLWDTDLVPFADKNALIPLDEFLPGSGIRASNYIPVYWNKCVYKGHVWGLPSTPSTTGLYYNKALFRKAGLDPERPPTTLAELDADSERLTTTDSDNQITQIGFLPSDPGWWPYFWGHEFGGRLWDGNNITANSASNIQGYTWVQRYARRYGTAALHTFQSGLGNYDSPQNSFISGRVAMVMQGVWLANLIHLYNPKMEWGAAPFPVVKAGDAPVTVAGADMLMIPRGAKHPREAFAFIAYVNRQDVMERLCSSQYKNSPLTQVSPGFLVHHPNPYIKVFQDVAWSKNAFCPPMINVWTQYADEISNAFDSIWLLQATPREALGVVQGRIEEAWDQERARAALPPSPWLRWIPGALVVVFLLGVLLLAARGEWKQSKRQGARSFTRMKGQLYYGLAFAGLGIIGLGVFILYPIAASLMYSFCDYSVLSQPRWIGLGNFSNLFHDSIFWLSIRNTLVYAAVSVPLSLLLSFVSAVLLDTRVRGTGIYRVIFFLPWVMPMVAGAMVWMWIFNSQWGILNYLLGLLSWGLIKPLPWLTDAHFAMSSLVLMSLWGIGPIMMTLLAGLQDVPAAMYEAAELDGAGWWHKLWYIAAPLVSPVLYFNLLMGIIGSLQIFAVPYIMTGGGPTRSTLFYSQYLYENAFSYLRMGYASAMAWILFLMILFLTGVVGLSLKNKVHYIGGA